MKKNRTRSRLCMDIAVLLISRFPVSWKASELAIITKANIRAVHRAINDLVDSGLAEKHYASYRLAMPLANQIYDARWYVKQEATKNITVQKAKEEQREQK